MDTDEQTIITGVKRNSIYRIRSMLFQVIPSVPCPKDMKEVS